MMAAILPRNHRIPRIRLPCASVMVCRLGPPMLGAASGLAIWLADGMARVCAVHSVPLYQRTSRGFAGSGYQPGEVGVVTRASHQTKWLCGIHCANVFAGAKNSLELRSVLSSEPTNFSLCTGGQLKAREPGNIWYAPGPHLSREAVQERSYPARHGPFTV